MNAKNCSCGAAKTHRVRVAIVSNVGVATKFERACGRCADRIAWRLLSAGTRQVAVEVLG